MEQIRIGYLNTRLKLFALWIFVLLNIIFRDIHQLTLKSHLEMLLTGYFNGMEVTDTIMLIGAFVVNVPIGMLLVSLLGARPWNRRLQPAAVVILSLSFMASPPTDMDDVFHLAVELVALAAIAYTAMTWKEAHLLSGKSQAHDTF